MVRVWSLSRRKELLRGREAARVPWAGAALSQGGGRPARSSPRALPLGEEPLAFTETDSVSRAEAQGSTGGRAPRLGPRRLSVGSQRLLCLCPQAGSPSPVGPSVFGGPGGAVLGHTEL